MGDWLLRWISVYISDDQGSAPLRASTPVVTSVYTPVLPHKHLKVPLYAQLTAILRPVDAPALQRLSSETNENDY